MATQDGMQFTIDRRRLLTLTAGGVTAAALAGVGAAGPG